MNAVITGGTKGIGRAIAELFLEKGANIAICSRTAKDLETFKDLLLPRFSNQDILTKQADLKNKTEVLGFSGFVLSHWNKVDVLVNNAGIFIPGKITEEKEGILEHNIETNLYSAYHLTRAILPAMTKDGSGHIFNMCSIASLFAYPNGGSYSISKFALLGFSKVLREELKEIGIKVTSVIPGATWSDSWAGANFPQERLMKSDDIARSVWSAFTLSPSAVVEEILIRPQLGDL